MNATPEQSPESIVAGPKNAPGTVVVRRSVVVYGCLALGALLMLMLWFVLNHAGNIGGSKASKSPQSDTGSSAGSGHADVADLGLPSHPTEALAQPTPVHTYIPPTPPPQFIAPPAPPPVSVPMPAVHIESTTNPQQKLASEAAESDLDVSFHKSDKDKSSDVVKDQTGSLPRSISHSTNPDDYDKAPTSDYVLQRGMIIPATLYTSIDSTIPGTIVAFVNQDVYDAQKRAIVIPRGSRMSGSYGSAVVAGQKRLAASWDAIHLPNGHTIPLGSMAGVDLSGTSGLGAKVDNHTQQLFAHVILLSVLATAGQLAQQPSGTSCGSTTCSNVTQTMASALGSQLIQTGNTLVQRDTSITPTLHVVEGAQIAIMVEYDLPLHRWGDTANSPESSNGG